MLPLLLGVALHGAVAGLLPAEQRQALRLKWPNDLLWQERKLAGILLERLHDAQEERWLIAGFGVNLAHAPEDLPFPAAALLETGVAATLERVSDALLAALDAGLQQWQVEGAAAVREAWLRYAWALGEDVGFVSGGERYSGRFSGIDESGALLLEQADGTVQSYRQGEIAGLRKQV